MMMDRLHEIESTCDALKMDVVELRAENAAMRKERDLLHLTPASNYTEFSDGVRFDWNLDRGAWQDGPQGYHGPLDEEHENAYMPGVPNILCLNINGMHVHEIDELDRMCNLTIGIAHPDDTIPHLLTVNQFVDRIVFWMNDLNEDGETNFTKHLESAKRFISLCLPTADDQVSGCMFVCFK